MKFKIKTKVLQDMVGKAITCSSNNKLIPITSLMNIKVSGGTLYLTTTDGTTYFFVKAPETVECEDFELSVIADHFTKFIQKTTSENITLECENKSLIVKGNGEYTIELPVDENGNIIKFPNVIVGDNELTQIGVISPKTIKAALDYNKQALSTSMSYPSITCYYCGDNIITTDKVKLCATDIKAFDSPVLISSFLMELLGVLTQESINVYTKDDKLIFETEYEYIISTIVNKVEEYPMGGINGLLSTEFNSSCVISKSAVLDVLDRLSLFMSNYDNKGIDITITKDGVVFSTKKSNGVELIPFSSVNNFTDYACRVNIEILKSQLSTHSVDEITLYYGDPKLIKLVSANITQLIALMVGEE